MFNESPLILTSRVLSEMRRYAMRDAGRHSLSCIHDAYSIHVHTDAAIAHPPVDLVGHFRHVSGARVGCAVAYSS